MKNIAVFASGNGSNLQAIIDAIDNKRLKARCALVVSDVAKAFALKRAKKAGIKTFYTDPKKFESKQAYEACLIDQLKKEKVELVVLAGFMRILSPWFVKKYKNRILNIHPALLPAFKGARAIKDAYLHGAKVTGVTVHFVDEKVDNGPILAQRPVAISDDDTIQALEEKIHIAEHKLYPRVIGRILKSI